MQQKRPDVHVIGDPVKGIAIACALGVVLWLLAVMALA
jgi:ElaB/YqjD/DUF883 family membrane-anchored ribosome-binding protein